MHPPMSDVHLRFATLAGPALHPLLPDLARLRIEVFREWPYHYEGDAADPRRPAGHVPLDAFWRKRGYTPRPDLTVSFDWKEVGATAETPHLLSFWIRDLGA